MLVVGVRRLSKGRLADRIKIPLASPPAMDTYGLPMEMVYVTPGS